MPPKKKDDASQKRTVRRWSPEENTKILEYLSDTVAQGYSIGVSKINFSYEIVEVMNEFLPETYCSQVLQKFDRHSRTY